MGETYIKLKPTTQLGQQLSTLLKEKQAAEYLNVSPAFLAKNRCYSKGKDLIPYVKLGARAIRYDRQTLDNWLNTQLQSFNVEGA